jgi:hypothetical protein
MTQIVVLLSDMASTGTVSFRRSEQEGDVLAQCLREQELVVTLTLAVDAPGDAGDEQVDHRMTIAPGANGDPSPGTLRTAARRGAEEFRIRFPEVHLVIQMTEGGHRAS